jgi:hypothetical protein
MSNYAQMAPLFVDSFGRVHQQPTNGYQSQFGTEATVFPLSAFPAHEANPTHGGLPFSIQGQSLARFQPMYDNFQLSMSAPARMPMYQEYMTPMAMPIPQQHPGLFRVSSAAPVSVSLEPASGPQRSVSARPALETAPLRRESNVNKEEKQPVTKVKQTGVAFPAYVDRVEVPAEWKSIYDSGKELPSGFSRPPYDYAGLIGRILLEGGDTPKRMTVAELFYALINKYPFYMAHPRLLYNGLRHNLTGCDALIKADRQWGDQASSRYWTIKPGCESCFGTGYYVKDSASRGAARARKVALAEAQSIAIPAGLIDSASGVSSSKSRVIPYTAKSSGRRSTLKKTTSSAELENSENALEMTGMKRKALSNKTNSSSRKFEAHSFIDVNVNDSDNKATIRTTGSKKGSATAKMTKQQPHCVTLPSTTGMVFPTTGGILTPAPMPLQYGGVSNYVPSTRPMPLGLTLDNTMPEANKLSSLSSLAISAPNSYHQTHVSESSASESDMTSPDSSLASAMDFTLVRRRSQEELQAAMQQ